MSPGLYTFAGDLQAPERHDECAKLHKQRQQGHARQHSGGRHVWTQGAEVGECVTFAHPSLELQSLASHVRFPFTHLDPNQLIMK